MRGTAARVVASLGILAASLAISRVIVQRQSRGATVVPRAPSAQPFRPARPASSHALSTAAAGATSPSFGPAAPPPAPTALKNPHELPVMAEDPLSDTLCPKGMLHVDGTTCADPKRRCESEDPDHPGTCVRYAAASCRSGLALRYCMDRHEYPNLPGMVPAVMITYRQATDACDAEGKRLCTESEWTLACEGPGGFAFSYGDEQQTAACNVGRPIPKVSPEELWEPRNVASVVERVDARVPSASQAACVSPYGVHDLVGNVEEWVQSASPGFGGALRGGGYGGAPSCRAVRQMRDPGFRQFHTGFRCCSDPVRAPSNPANSRETTGRVRPALVAPRARFD